MNKIFTSSVANKKKPRIYYGYIVVAACFIIMVFAYGSQASFGVFFKPMLNEFGWTRAETSGPFALCMIMSGLLTIISGRMNDRFGPRIVVSFGGLMLGLGYLLMSRINNLWELYLFYGVVIAMGLSTTYVPLVSLIARWFTKRRGLMSGIGIAGLGFGIGVVPVIASQLIESFDWRTALVIVGSVSLIMIVLLSQFLKTGNGQADPEDRPENPPIPGLPLKEFSFREAVRTKLFWMIFIAWIFYGFFFQVGVVHIVPHATDLGMTAVAAATVLTTIGLVGVIGRIGIGLVGDRLGIKTTILVSFFIIALAYLGLASSSTIWMIYVFAVIFGLFSGLGILLVPAIAEYFGFTALGAISGAMVLANNFGSAISPPLAGWIFDVTGNYQVAFISCGIGSLAAGIIFRLLKPLKRRR